MTDAMMKPRLSVIVPVRDAERTLGESLESCLSQSFGEFELVVVLNGCSDRSAEIAKGFASYRLTRAKHYQGFGRGAYCIE